MTALALTDPTLYHQLKKQRRKRGPKWTVQQTNELLDALHAYVMEKGYPSSSEHGKSDEWSVICRQAQQEGRFTGYQACNRISNLRKDLNAYLETTHLRFLSDAQQNAQSIVQQHFPHASLDVQREKEQEIANYIRRHTKFTTDWCSLLELDDGPDTLPSPYFDDVNKQLTAAKHKNVDLYSYHSRFKLVCDAMRANQTAAGERKRARAKRKTDGDGAQMNGSGEAGGGAPDGRESVGAVGVGGTADTLSVVDHHESEQSVGELVDMSDDHAVDDLLPPLNDHDDDESNIMVKEDHDEQLTADHMTLTRQHHHHTHHHTAHMDDGQQQEQHHVMTIDKKPLPSSSPLTATITKTPRKRPHSDSLDLSSNDTSQSANPPTSTEKKKKLTTTDVLAQLHAALLDVESVRAKRKERIEEAFSSKAEWYDRLMLTEEERARIDRHVRSLIGVFGVTHEMLVACLDPVSVGTWKKMVERYE